jgi:hypothetical protein
MSLRTWCLLAVLALGGAGASVLSGCEIPLYIYPIECDAFQSVDSGCELLCIKGCLWDQLDGGTDAAPDGATDGGTASLEHVCDGECVAVAHTPFLGPVLLWTGPTLDPASAPEACPEKAPVADVWHADLSASPASCGACSCDSPAGSCTLPTTLTASSMTCGGPQSGVKYSPFNAPAGWAGGCTSMDKLADGELCNGVPCVKSLTIAGLDVTDGDCTAKTAPSPNPPSPPTWGITTVICQGTPSTGTAGCTDPGMVCTPAAAPGFSQCVWHEGVSGCPAYLMPYTERHVLYRDPIDQRGCSPCTCGAEAEGSCLAKVSVFADEACSDLVATISIDATGPACLDVLPAGSALGSKSASPPVYQPGTCKVGGGEPIGAVLPDPVTAQTLCCIPSTPV